MKKFLLPILIVLVIVSVLYYKNSHIKTNNKDVSSYRNTNLGISFKYPNILIVKAVNSQIIIHHEVPFEHHDFCDFKGKATTTIKSLTDLNIALHIADKNILETMKTESPYIPEENFLNSEVVVSPGFIDAVNFGNLNGYKIFEGAEGCGHTIYYLKVKENKTLVLIDDFITIFSGSIDTENMQKALAVPGVINKQQSESIFSFIVKSLVIQ